MVSARRDNAGRDNQAPIFPAIASGSRRQPVAAGRATIRLGIDNGEAASGMDDGAGGGKTKAYLIGGSIVALLLFVVLIVVLYLLGGPDQSPLQRLRDIAIIFIVLLHLVVVVLLAGIAAALAYLVIQIKDRVIPLLEEFTGTARRARGTVEFVTEEAVRPIVNVAGTIARVRAMAKAASGKKVVPPL